MKTGIDIRQILKEIVGIDKIPMAVLGTVSSVDESEMTCVVNPIDEGPEFMDVLLMAESSSTGMYFKPTIGSLVMISPQNSETFYVSMYSAVDEVWIRGEANGGIPKVTPLVEKLNNIENLLNDLITKFNSHTHILTLSSGTGTAAPTTTVETGTLTPTTDADVESTTVKHG